MNAAHLHLMLNHVPVVGLVFALSLLGWGILRKQDALMKAAFAALVVVALLAVPAFLTGEPAEEIVKGLPGVSHAVVEQHENAAKVALAATCLTGCAALAGLWLARGKAVALWCVALVLMVALLAAGLMAWTANLGGKVRHTEIRATTPSHSAPKD
jgi:uncharacterized membrane protein